MNADVRCLYIFVLSILPIFNHAQIWVARYDGPAHAFDDAQAIVVDDHGAAYVTGKIHVTDINTDYATIKYDSTGVEQWVALYDGPSNYLDGAEAIALDRDGNVLVTGSSYGILMDYATVKYNKHGAVQWVARYSGPYHGLDYAHSIGVDNAGNVYVTGSSEGSYDDSDLATVKYDSRGVEQWVARYDGPWYPISHDGALGVAVDGSGNVYVTGVSRHPVTWADYTTIKYNSMGSQQWVALYNGTSASYPTDVARAIAVDDAGDIYVTGMSEGSGSSYDYATVKYNSMGVEQWVARYDGPNHGEDKAQAIALDNDGNIYVTGSSQGYYDRDYLTVKYDSRGVEQWVARYNYIMMCDFAHDIALSNAGDVYVTGGSNGSFTNLDYATIKYSPTGIEENTQVAKKENVIIATILCRPLQLPEGKKCKVFDITGRVVEPHRLQPGIYFIEIDNKIVQKVIKIR